MDNNGSVILVEGNTFPNNSEYGVRVWLEGSLNMWGNAQLTSPTTISGNTEGTIHIGSGGSANLCNLTLTSPTRGISAGTGAALYMRNITITNSQKKGIALWGATAIIDNATITGSAEEGIKRPHQAKTGRWGREKREDDCDNGRRHKTRGRHCRQTSKFVPPGRHPHRE